MVYFRQGCSENRLVNILFTGSLSGKTNLSHDKVYTAAIRRTKIADFSASLSCEAPYAVNAVVGVGSEHEGSPFSERERFSDKLESCCSVCSKDDGIARRRFEELKHSLPSFNCKFCGRL